MRVYDNREELPEDLRELLRQAEAAAVRAAAAGNQSGGDQMPFLAFIFANTAVGRP